MGNREWGGGDDKDAAEHFSLLRRSGDFLVSTCRARSPYGRWRGLSVARAQAL